MFQETEFRDVQGPGGCGFEAQQNSTGIRLGIQ